MRKNVLLCMGALLMTLVGMTACDKENEDNPVKNPEDYKGHKMLVNGRTWNYVFLYKEGETIDTVYSSITIEGPVEFEGRQCYKVVPTSIEEPQVFFYEEGSKVYIYYMDYGDFEHGYPFVWKEAFDFDLKVGDRFVENFKKFDDVKDIVMKLTGFFFYIENNVNIPVKKCLEVSESLKKQVMRQSTNLFEEVETI